MNSATITATITPHDLIYVFNISLDSAAPPPPGRPRASSDSRPRALRASALPPLEKGTAAYQTLFSLVDTYMTFDRDRKPIITVEEYIRRLEAWGVAHDKGLDAAHAYANQVGAAIKKLRKERKGTPADKKSGRRKTASTPASAPATTTPPMAPSTGREDGAAPPAPQQEWRPSTLRPIAMDAARKGVTSMLVNLVRPASIFRRGPYGEKVLLALTGFLADASKPKEIYEWVLGILNAYVEAYNSTIAVASVPVANLQEGMAAAAAIASAFDERRQQLEKGSFATFVSLPHLKASFQHCFSEVPESEIDTMLRSLCMALLPCIADLFWEETEIERGLSSAYWEGADKSITTLSVPVLEKLAYVAGAALHRIVEAYGKGRFNAWKLDNDLIVNYYHGNRTTAGDAASHGVPVGYIDMRSRGYLSYPSESFFKLVMCVDQMWGGRLSQATILADDRLHIQVATEIRDSAEVWGLFVRTVLFAFNGMEAGDVGDADGEWGKLYEFILDGHYKMRVKDFARRMVQRVEKTGKGTAPIREERRLSEGHKLARLST